MFKINESTQLPKKCMFFGYGSLMYPDGINGRGMRHIYKSYDELLPITINGLKRSMSCEVVMNLINTVIHVISPHRYRYYSINFNNASKVFGMLFEVHDKRDLKKLLSNENAQPIHSNGVYSTYDITDMVTNYKSKLPILTLVCKELKDKPSLYAPGYVETVFYNIPKKFRHAFMYTGGLAK